MESLVRIFEADKDFVNVNPFLKTYLFVTKKVQQKNKLRKNYFENFADYP